MSRKPKTPRQKAIAYATKHFNRYIVLRDGASVTSGKTENLTCSHLLTAAHHSTKWDELNCHAQTAGENFMHEHNPSVYTHWFLMTYGVEAYDELYRKHWTPRKFSVEEILAIGDHYKQRCEEIEEENDQCNE